MREGDVVLVRHKTLFGALIRFGERLRYRSRDRQSIRWRGFAFWNHVGFLVYDEFDWWVAEEKLPGGMQLTPFDDYLDARERGEVIFALVETGMDAAQTARAVAAMEARLGTEYGAPTLLGEAFALVTGWKLTWMRDKDALICSEAVSDWLTAGVGYDVVRERSSGAVPTPADVASEFNVGRLK